MAIAEDIEARVQALAEQNEALLREIKILREELAILKKGLFGRKSERLERGQLAMFAEGEEGEPTAQAPSPAETKPKKAKRKGHGRAPFALDVPRETIELDLGAEERACPCCGKEMRVAGWAATGTRTPSRGSRRREGERTEDSKPRESSGTVGRRAGER